jgi:hypothetical protein
MSVTPTHLTFNSFIWTLKENETELIGKHKNQDLCDI